MSTGQLAKKNPRETSAEALVVSYWYRGATS
jgi:hypothetical protein